MVILELRGSEVIIHMTKAEEYNTVWMKMMATGCINWSHPHSVRIYVWNESMF